MKKLLQILGNQRGEVEVTEPVEPTEPVAPVEPSEPAETVEPPAPEPVVPRAAVTAERKKRQEAEKEAAYWRGVAEAGGKAPAATPVEPAAPAVPVPPVKPKKLVPGDFDDWEQYEAAQERQDDEYQAARDKYISDKILYESEQRQQQQVQQQTQQQKIQAHATRLEKAAELDPELLDIANNWHLPGQYQLPLTQAVQDTILESEVGPEMLRHLYNNKQDAIRIAKLPPVAAVRELVKIETSIMETNKTPVRRVSNAPPPVTPVTGSRGSVEADDDKRPAADVIAEYRKASARR